MTTTPAPTGPASTEPAWPHRGPRVVLVAAVGRNGVIGVNGGMPWHLPEDFAHFKATTLNSTIIMGRGQWVAQAERPLPKRRNVVITRQEDFEAPGAEVVHSLAEAYRLAADEERVNVIGGGQIYAEALPGADEMIISEVHLSPEGDTYFPRWHAPSWREVSREPREEFDIVTWHRVAPDPVEDADHGATVSTTVRTATPEDAPAIGKIHAGVFATTYASVIPADQLDDLSEDVFRDAWASSLTTPPSPVHRVIVAELGGAVVGFAAIAPCTDADAEAGEAELVALAVDPAYRRQGHGSRLLNTAADTLRANDFTEAIAWVLDTDVATGDFLTKAGLMADGANRTRQLSDEQPPAREVRLRASLSGSAESPEA